MPAGCMSETQPARLFKLEVIIVISAYFGPPGCGKSSVLTIKAQRELKRIAKGKSKYQHVYTNFPCSGCEKIDFFQLGELYYHDSLIILDEITLYADSRDFKHFSKQAKEFITLHRHFNIDIIISLQDWSRCDKTIRENVVALYYVTNFLWWAKVRPIFRTININEYMGDLIMGYRFPDLIEQLQSGHIYFIKSAWKYYNSYDKYGFDQLPDPIRLSEKWE